MLHIAAQRDGRENLCIIEEESDLKKSAFKRHIKFLMIC